MTDQGWTKQLTTRTFPYGHDEVITFTEAPDLSTEMETVFRGEYTVIFPLKNSTVQNLNAAVKQKYYVDKKSKVLTKIETDLTELNCIHNISTCINVNGSSLDEAQKQVLSSDEGIKEINTLTISDYGNPNDFQIPLKIVN